MGAQWADTWSFDDETVAVRFDIPVEVLRSEVTSYLRRRANYGDRRNRGIELMRRSSPWN